MIKKIKDKLKKFFSYVVCLTTPSAIVNAINEAASVSEFDARVAEKAGIVR